MEKKKFKKKLTLSISGSTHKRSDKIEYVKSQNKSSVIVEKKNIRSGFRKINQQFGSMTRYSKHVIKNRFILCRNIRNVVFHK